MAGQNNTALLKLSTELAPRKFITVDEKKYELRNLGEFDVVEQQRLSSMAAKFGVMAGSSDALNKEDAEVLKSSLDGMFLSVLIEPLELVVKLTDAQKVQVLEVFLEQTGSAKKKAKSSS